MPVYQKFSFEFQSEYSIYIYTRKVVCGNIEGKIDLDFLFPLFLVSKKFYFLSRYLFHRIVQPFKQITGTRSRIWNRSGDFADIRMESITLVLAIETRELLKYHEAALCVYVYIYFKTTMNREYISSNPR